MVHIFVDFEMNQVSKRDRDQSGVVKNEIIQIGAVKLDKDYKVVSMYEAYVKPLYSSICPICTRLTGIVQDHVENALPLPQAITEFLAWVDDSEARYYSWSDNDSRQIRSELAAKGVDETVITLFDNWNDFQKEYCSVIGQSRMGLDIALKGAGLKQIGSKHSAAADALSSVQLLKLIRSPKFFTKQQKQNITLYTKTVREQMQEQKQAQKQVRAQRRDHARNGKTKAKA